VAAASAGTKDSGPCRGGKPPVGVLAPHAVIGDTGRECEWGRISDTVSVSGTRGATDHSYTLVSSRKRVRPCKGGGRGREIAERAMEPATLATATVVVPSFPASAPRSVLMIELWAIELQRVRRSEGGEQSLPLQGEEVPPVVGAGVVVTATWGHPRSKLQTAVVGVSPRGERTLVPSAQACP